MINSSTQKHIRKVIYSLLRYLINVETDKEKLHNTAMRREGLLKDMKETIRVF